MFKHMYQTAFTLLKHFLRFQIHILQYYSTTRTSWRITMKIIHTTKSIIRLGELLLHRGYKVVVQVQLQTFHTHI